MTEPLLTLTNTAQNEPPAKKFDHQSRLDVTVRGITIVGGYCNGMPAWLLHGGIVTNSKAVAKQWALACEEVVA